MVFGIYPSHGFMTDAEALRHQDILSEASRKNAEWRIKQAELQIESEKKMFEAQKEQNKKLDLWNRRVETFHEYQWQEFSKKTGIVIDE